MLFGNEYIWFVDSKIAESAPDSLRSRIFGVHFFNPPRYLPLVELIRTSYSDESLLTKAEGFITSALGKEVVYAKDSPAFVANRIGVFSFMAVLKHAENFNLSADTVDALTGKRIGRPASATFRTLDVVGLDVMANVVKIFMKTQRMILGLNYFSFQIGLRL